MARSNDDKTAAVHFLRFQLPDALIAAVKHGGTIRMGIDHALLEYSAALPPATVASLAGDLAG